MWIFTTNEGFASVVQDLDFPGTLQVRCRVLQDAHNWADAIAAMTNSGAEFTVVAWDGADYAYRIQGVPPALFGNLLANLVDDIDYPDFKSTLPVQVHDAYLDVWTATRNALAKLDRLNGDGSDA